MAQPEPPERMGVAGRSTFLSGMRPQDTKRQASKAIMNERNLTGHPSFLERDTLAGEEFFLKTIRHSHLALFFLCALASAAAWAEPTKVTASPANAVQWRFDAGFSGSWVPSWEDERPFLSAAGFGFDAGIGVALGNWIICRGGLGLFSVGSSGFDASLWRYRAFEGLSLSLASGYRFAFDGAELDLLAGGAISASRYAATSLVTAYLSVLLEPRLLVPLRPRGLDGWRLDFMAGLPMEYLFRGAAQSFSLGLEAGLSLRLGKGGR